MIGGPMSAPLVGPLGHLAAVKLSSIVDSRKAAFFIASFNRGDMESLASMLEDGTIKPVVDEVYPFDKIGDALAKIGIGHVRGKLVVAV